MGSGAIGADGTAGSRRAFCLFFSFSVMDTLNSELLFCEAIRGRGLG